MSRDVYVWYRIVPTQRAAAEVARLRTLATLAGCCSQPPSARERCDDPTTWMEIYPGVIDPTTFDATLRGAAAAFDGLLIGGRQIECFVACPAVEATPGRNADAG